MKHACHGEGELFVYTGFPVQSVVIVPIGLGSDSELKARVDESSTSGFYVEYSNIPVTPGMIQFSFTAQ